MQSPMKSVNNKHNLRSMRKKNEGAGQSSRSLNEVPKSESNEFLDPSLDELEDGIVGKPSGEEQFADKCSSKSHTYILRSKQQSSKISDDKNKGKLRSWRKNNNGAGQSSRSLHEVLESKSKDFLESPLKELEDGDRKEPLANKCPTLLESARKNLSDSLHNILEKHSNGMSDDKKNQLRMFRNLKQNLRRSQAIQGLIYKRHSEMLQSISKYNRASDKAQEIRAKEVAKAKAKTNRLIKEAQKKFRQDIGDLEYASLRKYLDSLKE